MRLELKTPHLSIKELPETVLPDLTIITGLNGSGKTHLLKAIDEGHIQTDVTSNPKDEISIYSWSTLVPASTGTANIQGLQNQRNQVCQWAQNARNQLQGQLDQTISQFGLTKVWPANSWRILELSLDELRKIATDQKIADQAYSALQNLANAASAKIL